MDDETFMDMLREDAAAADRERLRFRQPGEPLTAEHLETRWKVLKQAENEPDSFRMGWWESDEYDDTGSECSTTRCIGGWAQFFLRGQVILKLVDRDAVEALGLSEDEYYGDDTPWPGPVFFLSDETALKRLRVLCTVATG